ncbi:MAG: FtsX-like permease family protein [Acidobacteria bacterium]|nr:FtsX-like permease family protein [Acidobacteriota bacterium]
MDRQRSRTRWRFLPQGVARRAESEVRAEIDLYIELRAEELIEEGHSPERAQQLAEDAFGEVDVIVGDCLDTTQRRYWRQRREETMGSLIRDIKFALRTLRRAPRLVAAVTITLALGIGANSAIFSVLDAVVLRPLAYPESDRLFVVWTQFPEQGDFEFPSSAAEYLDYAAETEAFESMAAYAVFSRVLTGHGAPAAIAAAFTTATTWELLGARATIGRLYDQADDQPDSANVAVLAHDAWTNLFGADPSVIGRAVEIGGIATTIIGVLEQGFTLPENPADIYQPLGLRRDLITDRSGHYLTVVGRAREGIAVERIASEMEAVSARWTAEYPHAHPLGVEALRDEVGGGSGLALVAVLGAVAAVLLIACANVAGLMLTRTLARQREMAIRAAIGAARRHLARQVLVEGVVLASLGGLLGLGLAALALPAILRLEPGDLPRLGEVGIDGRVVVFTGVVAVLSGVLFSLVPALRMSGFEPQRALAGGGRSSGDASRQRFLRGIVMAEIALALVLVTAAGLLTRSFSELMQVDAGLQSEGAFTSRVTLPRSAYADPQLIRTFFDALQTEVEAIPGVQQAGAIRRLPLADGGFMEVFLKEDESIEDPNAGHRFEYQMATEEYFAAAGIELASGRSFLSTDDVGTERVAIINETVARMHFAGEDPVGQTIQILASVPSTEPFRIVGVARDVLQDNLGSVAPPQIYVSHRQATEYMTGMTTSLAYLIRTREDPAALGEAFRAAVNRIDPELATTGTSTMEAVIWESLARPRFLALLLSMVGALALTLAGIGVYGVVSYGVEQRTKEFGIRMALGAQRGQVIRMVVSQGARPALAGAAVGLVSVLLVGQLVVNGSLGGLLFGISPYDPGTIGGVALTLLAVALLAAWVPARRAVRVEAVEAIAAD